MLLNGFDYATYLKRHFWVGQIDPWRRTEQGKKLYTLLTSVQHAMDECKLWSGQEFTKAKFIDYLKLNDILVFYSPEDMVKVKVDNIKTPKRIKHTKNFSEETKKMLAERMKRINQKKQETEIPSVS